MILTLRVPVEQGEAVVARIDQQEQATRRAAELPSRPDDHPGLPTADSPMAARRADAAIELLTRPETRHSEAGGTGGTVEPLLVVHVSPEDLTASAEAPRQHLHRARRRQADDLQADWDGRHDTDLPTAIDFVTRELERHRAPEVAAAA